MVRPCLLSLAAASLAGMTRVGGLPVRLRIQAAVVARKLRSRKRFIARDLVGNVMQGDSFGMTRLRKPALLTAVPASLNYEGEGWFSEFKVESSVECRGFLPSWSVYAAIRCSRRILATPSYKRASLSKPFDPDRFGGVAPHPPSGTAAKKLPSCESRLRPANFRIQHPKAPVAALQAEDRWAMWPEPKGPYITHATTMREP
jgi:hypothetical protein